MGRRCRSRSWTYACARRSTWKGGKLTRGEAMRAIVAANCISPCTPCNSACQITNLTCTRQTTPKREGELTFSTQPSHHVINVATLFFLYSCHSFFSNFSSLPLISFPCPEPTLEPGPGPFPFGNTTTAPTPPSADPLPASGASTTPDPISCPARPVIPALGEFLALLLLLLSLLLLLL